MIIGNHKENVQSKRLDHFDALMVFFMLIVHPIPKRAVVDRFLSKVWIQEKNLKIFYDNFFCIPKTYLHANFQEIWPKNGKALGF